jgi:ATP-binding cassette subfamily F protein 3
MGEEGADSGSVQIGHLVQFGYYDQQLKTLPVDLPVIRAVWPEPDPEIDEQKMRNLLGRFGLVGDQVYQQVSALSGGEKSRAALARLVALGVNVLVLDEPTNHLDLWACDGLEQALLEFDGTAIVVSHDRYFLNRVVDQLLVLNGGGSTRVIHGNYDTYELMCAERTDEKETRRQGDKETRSTEESHPAITRKRKRRFPYRKVEDLEAEIAGAETRLREVEALLASADLYRDGDKVKETMRAFEETKAKLKQLYEHWEEAVELN